MMSWRFRLRSFSELSAKRFAVLGASLTTGALALYLLLSEEKELLPESLGQTVTSRQTVIEVKIPKEYAGQVIGQQGIVIKQIQAESGAKIHFKDEAATDTERILIVRGNCESAQKAELMIKQIVHDIPEVHTVELLVPQRFLGRLIGKNGDNIRGLQRTTKAKIVVERTTDEKDPNASKKVTITGSAEQIEMAKGFISEQMEEEKIFREKQRIAAEMRKKKGGVGQRGQGGGDGNVVDGSKSVGTNGMDGKCSASGSNSSVTTSASRESNYQEIVNGTNDPRPFTSKPPMDGSGDASAHGGNMKTEVAQLPEHDNFFEVYVSAIDTVEANRIWLQLFARTERLESLNQSMCNLYNSIYSDDYKLHEGGEIAIDDIVAAKLVAYDDNHWFRASVRKVDRTDFTLEVYYVDYGDTAVVSFKDIRSLRQDFLSCLPFQAVECLIANIEPRGKERADGGGEGEGLSCGSANDEEIELNNETNVKGESDIGNEINQSVADVIAEIVNTAAKNADADSIDEDGDNSNVVNTFDANMCAESNALNLLTPSADTSNHSADASKLSTAEASKLLPVDVAPTWKDDDLDFVDQVTKNAQWIVLYAKILGFKEDKGKMLPLLQLLDTTGPHDVDIASSIVEAGHADFIDPTLQYANG